MRCYFMKGGHIAAVELLDEGISDVEAIKRSGDLFAKRAKENFEGFEVWDRNRMVARFPEPDRPSGENGSNGATGRKNGGSKGKQNAPAPSAGMPAAA